MRVNCEWCGNTCSKSAHEVRRWNYHFCDYKCRGKWMKGKPKIQKKPDMSYQRRLKGLKIKKRKVWFRP